MLKGISLNVFLSILEDRGNYGYETFNYAIFHMKLTSCFVLSHVNNSANQVQISMNLSYVDDCVEKTPFYTFR